MVVAGDVRCLVYHNSPAFSTDFALNFISDLFIVLHGPTFKTHQSASFCLINKSLHQNLIDIPVPHKGMVLGRADNLEALA